MICLRSLRIYFTRRSSSIITDSFIKVPIFLCLSREAPLDTGT